MSVVSQCPGLAAQTAPAELLSGWPGWCCVSISFIENLLQGCTTGKPILGLPSKSSATCTKLQSCSYNRVSREQWYVFVEYRCKTNGWKHALWARKWAGFISLKESVFFFFFSDATFTYLICSCLEGWKRSLAYLRALLRVLHLCVLPTQRWARKPLELWIFVQVCSSSCPGHCRGSSGAEGQALAPWPEALCREQEPPARLCSWVVRGLDGAHTPTAFISAHKGCIRVVVPGSWEQVLFIQVTKGFFVSAGRVLSCNFFFLFLLFSHCCGWRWAVNCLLPE